MKVVVTGGTGNVGTSLVPLLEGDDTVSDIVSLSRRGGDSTARTNHHRADIAHDDLAAHFAGADVVVHLAWAIQPSHRPGRLWMTNVLGTRRVFEAAASAGAGALVYASSIGVYSTGRSPDVVDESGPRSGTETSFYSRHKATAEWFLDDFEERHPEMRVVRFRPALIFKRQAAEGIRKLFLGRFLPRGLMGGALPVFPFPGDLRFQAVHTDDVAAAYHQAVVSDVSGPFNLASDPVLDPETMADLLDSTHVSAPLWMLRAGAGVTWGLRLHPTPPGWLSMAANVPVMSSERARHVLGWKTQKTSVEALAELLDGIASGDDFPTPPLRRTRLALVHRPAS